MTQNAWIFDGSPMNRDASDRQTYMLCEKKDASKNFASYAAAAVVLQLVNATQRVNISLEIFVLFCYCFANTFKIT